MAVVNITTLFQNKDTGTWKRPTHETANRCWIIPGGSCCICVPPTATRVVVEMWGQGGGGAGGCCCMWGMRGGTGGSYAYKIWSGATSPVTLGINLSFCGCVCACDCKSYDQTGSCGQFSRLQLCNGSQWLGCVSGGAPGYSCCTAATWQCCGTTYNCLPESDFCAMFETSSSSSSDSSLQTTYLGTHYCTNEVGPSCLCGGSYMCFCASTGVQCSVTPAPISYSVVTSDPSILASSSGNWANVDCYFSPVGCACFDFYRLGNCGFTKLQCYIPGYSQSYVNAKYGIGGAAYGGGRQQFWNCSMGNWAFCGASGNFPGGGGRSSGVCSGSCCAGSYGGGGLILISWV